jgi:hypothetical protein
MKRRNLVALVALIVFAFLGLLAVSVVLFVTRTQRGRDWVRDLATPLIARAAKGGTVYVGQITGNFLTGFTVDTFAIRTNVRALSEHRPRQRFIQSARHSSTTASTSVARRFSILTSTSSSATTYAGTTRRFSRRAAGPPPLKDVTRRSLGDYIVIDTTTVTDGTFPLTDALDSRRLAQGPGS